jgi:protein-tyrosine phosphatase
MLQSVVNFRPVLASGCLRPGRLFRSGNCGNITDQEAKRLVTTHGIRTVIDLRSESERQRLGGLERLARHGIRCVNRPLHLDPRFRDLNDVQVHDYIRLYLHMVKLNRAMLAEIVTAAAAPAAAPLLITCGMGKDRTGVVCGLLLGLLGGSDEEIAEDFARSGPPLTACLERFRAHWLRRGITREAYARRLLCDGAIMRAWCERVRRCDVRWDGVARELGLGEAVLEDLAQNLAVPGSSARHALRPSSSAAVQG